MLQACRKNYFRRTVGKIIIYSDVTPYQTRREHLVKAHKLVYRPYSTTPKAFIAMSHKKNISLRPHDLWGVLHGQDSVRNGVAAPDSSPTGPIEANKIANKPKAVSTQSESKNQSNMADSLPETFVERNNFFDELWKKRQEEIAAKEKPSIKIVLSPTSLEKIDVEGKGWETTPGQLLKNVPKDRAGQIVVAKVNGVLWDLDRPLEQDSTVSYLTFDDSEGRDVFWHSSAHVLGECAEHEYGCRLSHGPPTAMGFFYDMALEPGRAVKESEWPSLEAKAKKYTKEKQAFERLEVSKDDLRKMFAYSKYKLHYIEKFVPDGESSTVYRNGSLVDLCQGPHIQNTKKIDAFKIMKNSSAYFMGDQANDALQRIHGVAFPNKQQLKDWLHFLEEAKKRDHQLIGKEQKLWMFDKLSPGSPFLLPHGTIIFNALQSMLREQYWERGYTEVQSPNMYDVDLWKTSGHWQHYQDDMFRVVVKDDSTDPMPLTDQKPDGKPIAEAKDKDKGVFALKPMNCPVCKTSMASRV